MSARPGGFSDLGLRFVSSTGFFISRLSGRIASIISSGVGENSLFLGGSVISKRRLGQLAFQFWFCAVLLVLGSLILTYQVGQLLLFPLVLVSILSSKESRLLVSVC